MTLETLVSGQAALYAVRNTDGYAVVRLDDEPFKCTPRELRYVFAGCNDVQRRNFRDHEEALAETKQAWSSDRALTLFIFLLDPTEAASDVREFAAAAEPLLSEAEVRKFVENRLYAHELPSPIGYSLLEKALKDYPVCLDILTHFIELQSVIAQVHHSYIAIPDDLFEANERQSFREAAIERGLVHELVMAAASNEGIESALFDLYSQLNNFPNSRALVNAWTTSFKRTPRLSFNLADLREPVESQSEEYNGYGGRKAYERAIAQQNSIVDRIQRGDLENARKFAWELVEQQSKESGPEHIAKSLTKLSKAARDLQAFQLSLEWAYRASEIKPDDPWTHGQLAELLVHFGRYTEALASLDEAEACGDHAFADSLRARILRQQNRPEEAFKAFEAARLKYRDMPEEKYAWAGVAETLRDLGRLDEALAEYHQAKDKFPEESGLACGFAATLAEIGRLGDALREYERAELTFGGCVPRNGVASVLAMAGDLSQAEEVYRNVIADYPFDIVSRTGLISVLRDTGRNDEALQLAKETATSFHESADAYRSLGDVYRAIGNLDEASEIYKQGIIRFPYDGYFLSALARVERDRGHYEASLEAFERAKSYFPNSLPIETGRAAMFRRLGRVDEALVIYDKLLQKNPDARFALNAKASILIYRGAFDEALKLLQVDDPKSKHEWRTFHLRAMLDIRTGYFDAAYDRLAWAVDRIPFSRDRKIFAATMASLELRRGDDHRALAVSEVCEGDVTSIVRLHALASGGEVKEAKKLYGELKVSVVPKQYFEIRDEIARKFGIIVGQTRHSSEWIYEQEANLLLLEAA